MELTQAFIQTCFSDTFIVGLAGHMRFVDKEENIEHTHQDLQCVLTIMSLSFL